MRGSVSRTSDSTMRRRDGLTRSAAGVVALLVLSLWQGTDAQSRPRGYGVCFKNVKVFWPGFDGRSFRSSQAYHTTCCIGYTNTQPPGECEDDCRSGCIVQEDCQATGSPSLCPNCERFQIKPSSFLYQNVPSQIDCKPDCPSGCIHGNCSETNLCTCDAGYHNAVNDESDSICIRNCKSTDRYCDCESSTVCVCNSGYMIRGSRVAGLSGRKCVPKCRNWHTRCNCRPEDCQCERGYQWYAPRSQCRPVCPSGCVNGECTQPDKCTCHVGYKTEGCTSNSMCVLSGDSGNLNCNCNPEGCACNPGYSRKGINGSCTEDCPDTCVNGACIQPNICACNEGYTESEYGTCVPRCPESCANGCTEPNVCACDLGYELNINDTGTSGCVPVCPPEDNCTCKAPNVCECYDGYERDVNGTCTQCITEGCKIQTSGLSVVILGSSIAAAVVAVLVIALLIILCRCKRREVKVSEDPGVPLEPNPEIDIRTSPQILEEEEDNCLYGKYRLNNDGNTVGVQVEEFPSFAEYEEL